MIASNIKMKKIIAVVFSIAAILCVSCKKEKPEGGTQPTPPQQEEPVAVVGVRIMPVAVAMRPHQEREFEVVVMPEDAANKNYTWSYDDTNLVAVEGKENTFRVLYYDTEDIVLTVTTEDGNFTAHSVITVTDPVQPTAITLSDPLEMKVGQTQTLSYEITPDEACACEEEICWSYEPYLPTSDSDCVISVNEVTGEITAINPGTATITIETVLGGVSDTKTIVVTAGDLTPATPWAWAGSEVQINAASEVTNWEVETPEGYQTKGKLEISQSGLLTLPLFIPENSEFPTDVAVTVKATLKDGSIAKCFVPSKGWFPGFYANSSDSTPATAFTAGKDAYLRVQDSEGSFLTYGEFMWTTVEYAEGSGVANSINRPSALNTYRTVQVRAGEYSNYGVSVSKGDVKFDFDLTPAE